MNYRKSLRELTIRDNFMFGAVMSDEENCRRLLELILQFPISRVEVSKEKSIVYHPEYKGIRLDVYAQDEANTHYNVEMQAESEKNIGKRSRYYHSHIDMELLQRGADYGELPNTYVIFICDFDPFGGGKYCYIFESLCRDWLESNLGDNRKSIFLSTKGKNREEVPEALVKFLEYVGAGLEESVQDFGDSYVAKLQKSVQDIKASRELEGRYMLFQEVLKKEYAEGMADGIIEGTARNVMKLLGLKGFVAEEIRARIQDEKDLIVLEKWLEKAATCKSVEEFVENL